MSMNKTKSLLLAGIVVLTAGMTSACGDSERASSVVNDAVKAAEEAVAIESTPVLGQIPSLQAQYKEARSQLKNHFKEAGEKLESKFKDGGSMEDALRESAKLEDERKAAEKELQQLFKEKVMAEAATISENALKVTFDESVYSAANAKFVASPDSSITNPVTIEVVLTLAIKPYAFCSWEYQDAANNKIKEGSLPIQDNNKLQAGDKITKNIIPPFSLEEGTKFDHLYFKKAR